VCANARTSVLGAPGCARDLKEDVVAQEQKLARRREDVAARATAAQRGERRVGKAAARQGRARGSVQCGAEAAGALHMAGKSSCGASGSKTEEEEEEEGR
jgi:hypothetical protein